MRCLRIQFILRNRVKESICLYEGADEIILYGNMNMCSFNEGTSDWINSFHNLTIHYLFMTIGHMAWCEMHECIQKLFKKGLVQTS